MVLFRCYSKHYATIHLSRGTVAFTNPRPIRPDCCNTSPKTMNRPPHSLVSQTGRNSATHTILPYPGSSIQYNVSSSFPHLWVLSQSCCRRSSEKYGNSNAQVRGQGRTGELHSLVRTESIQLFTSLTITELDQETSKVWRKRFKEQHV